MRRDEQPGLPDDVWQKFLRDSEAEIRRTAPREPSARERAAKAAASAAALTPTEPARAAEPAPPDPDAIGELWLPRPQREAAHWRDLDSRGRLRRAVRVLGAAAVFAAALALVSLLPNGGSPSPVDRPGIVLQEPKPAPTEQPTAEASPSPAVFSTP
ncbi:hypothetical protein [Streptomyces cavernicola]|uniref:Peptidoglycan-binding protein n=1 Tax=Streptomyces cavernicola TaxID=3043613 RepID=A0ABT6SBY9_9ACTN|nr:hypothetical protein [Streptomyces sp. B-S-A6]MDI3405008.1 hypothetical protein [Streptomyces sp. B-S-A6]